MRAKLANNTQPNKSMERSPSPPHHRPQQQIRSRDNSPDRTQHQSKEQLAARDQIPASLTKTLDHIIGQVSPLGIIQLSISNSNSNSASNSE